MAQHGYLGDGYGAHGDFDPDREDRGERWSDNRADRNRDSDRGVMFGDDDRSDAREWFGGRGRSDDRGMSHYGREHGFGGFQGDYSRSGSQQGGFGGQGDYRSGRTHFGSHQDDHYHSWRQRQIDALDRDYADYCREREQQFHQDFDSWRRNRQTQPQQGGSSEEVMDLDHAVHGGEIPGATTSPMGAATLGTNNSENSAGVTGRGRA
jgi:hypothetical protein